MWDRLRGRGMLPSTQLSLVQPYWSGAFWAVYPPRQDAGGTNEMREGDLSLVMVWTDAVADGLAQFASQKQVRPALCALGRQSSTWRAPLPDAGEIEMPVVGGEASRDLDSLCNSLADRAAAAIPEAGMCRALLMEAGVEAAEQVAAVIFAHEVIWEMARAFADQGIVTMPSEELGIGPHMFVRVD